MKLRIKGNSVRLRLTKGEVAQFEEEGMIEEFTEFGVGINKSLKYCLQKTDKVQQIEAVICENMIKVLVPQFMGHQWATGDDIAMTNLQINCGESKLRILIEKDFACLKERPFEDDSDAFPNPNA